MKNTIKLLVAVFMAAVVVAACNPGSSEKQGEVKDSVVTEDAAVTPDTTVQETPADTTVTQ